MFGVNVKQVEKQQMAKESPCDYAQQQPAREERNVAGDGKGEASDRAGEDNVVPDDQQLIIRKHLMALASRVEERFEGHDNSAAAAKRRQARAKNKSAGEAVGDDTCPSNSATGNSPPAKRARSASGASTKVNNTKRVAQGPSDDGCRNSKDTVGSGSENKDAEGANQKKKVQSVLKCTAGEATAAKKRNKKSNADRTLFSMPADAVTGVRRAASISFREVDNSDFLFDDMREALNDPNRIQTPTFYVAFATHGGMTNFSISSHSKGKVHTIHEAKPEKSHLEVNFFALRWKDGVFILSAEIGLSFLVRVLVDLPGVEIVTFNAPSLLLILLSYKQGMLFTSCISDIRVMSWMFETSASVELIADYDALLLSWQQQIGLAPMADDQDEAKAMISYRVHYMEPLYRSLYGQLGSQGMLPAFLKQEKRISILCASMKYNGILVNLSEVEGFKERCSVIMDELREAAQKMVPSMSNFNIQSPDDCRVAIYDVLGLGKHLKSALNDSSGNASEVSLPRNSVTTTKGGKPSTSEEALKMLVPHHEFPRIVIAYRKAAKILQTYTVGMMESAIPLTKQNNDDIKDSWIDVSALQGHDEDESHNKMKWAKIYPNFIQEGTETGRLSCVEPNMQGLPRVTVIGTSKEYSTSPGGLVDMGNDDSNMSTPEDAEGTSFRLCFAVPEGWTLISADYEQIELRVLAHLSADSALIEALTNSGDIHRSIGETIFRKSPISKEERTFAKRVVFGMLYGATPRSLAMRTNVSVEQALQISSMFRTSFPQVDTYQHRVVEQCRADGFVRTLSGRIRYLPEINDRIIVKRSHAERQAFNTVVQGSAADVMKLAMIAVEREVLQPFAPHIRLLLQLHDEMVFAAPTHLLQSVVPLVMQSMAHATSLLVPLRTKVKIGRSMGEMEEWSVDHELGVREPC